MSGEETTELPMFTAHDRTVLLAAHAALLTTIKYTRGGLTALSAQSVDVARIENSAAALKKALDDAHDRDRFELDASLKDVCGLALSRLVSSLEDTKKDAVRKGVQDPKDIEATIDHANHLGRQMRPALFPQKEKQEELL